MLPLATPALHRALDQTLRFGPGYPSPGGLVLSNHLPMVLTALQRLGAPAAALDRQLALWAPRLVEQPAPPAPPATCAAAVARLLPRLLEAPETSAFHGAIRLAYALDSGHDGETAHALAAWQAQRHSLGPLPPWRDADPDRPLPALLDALRADPRLSMSPRSGTTITSDLVVAVALPGFDAALVQARPSLDALAEAALAVYLATRDFTALHLVTGTHAMRLLLAHLPTDAAASAVIRASALRRHWRAWLAAWIAIGRPLPDWHGVHAGSAREADWDAALPALFTHGNDHAIKLADTAREEWRLRGWPGYARCLPGAAP